MVTYYVLVPRDEQDEPWTVHPGRCLEHAKACGYEVESGPHEEDALEPFSCAVCDDDASTPVRKDWEDGRQEEVM